MRSRGTICLCAIGSILFAGCGSKPLQPSDKHLLRQTVQPAATEIPRPLKRSVTLPPPSPAPKAETYSVVVTNLPAQEILFALARDAKINLDIHPGIQGTVTLNALDQTLPQLLARIAKQVDMRYELDNGNLIVMPDTPYLHHYKIDYVNVSRDSESAIVTSAQIAATSTPATAASGNNNSSVSINNVSRNRFWETLTQNIKDILRETDKILPEGSSETVVQQNNAARSTGTGAQTVPGRKPYAAGGVENSPNPVVVQEGGSTITRRSTFREAASVIANPETGIITVRATGKQHERIQEFVNQIMANARRQVMIEATIVEVQLSDNYKQGINWSALIKAGGKNFKIVQGSNGLPTAATAPGMLGIITNPTATTIAAQVNLLESFGTVKVLSSPKLSVLNNQTAMLRVVDNLVYFTIKADTTTNQTSSITTFTTTPNTVPIGFTMSVTPQISESDSVLFNLKPSISRVLSYINDPNPDLARANVISRIPQTQTREMESVLKIDSNQIAVMGGLMQDEINNLTDAVPGLSGIPAAGNLFTHRNDASTKTELVIFLRPMVIKEASLEGDFNAYRGSLPDREFFKNPAGGKP
ncbi:MAG TPA: pilus (MSHA type) biogenesis protein MshL [Gallionella sp.]|nr:pilus (MSHA type) biogenesis protein MshL [Gallionella sp.]